MELEAPVSLRVIQAVAERENTDPTDLEPLHNVVDPDALDALFSRSEPVTDGVPDVVKFDYCGHPVTVDRSRGVLIDDQRASAKTANPIREDSTT